MLFGFLRGWTCYLYVSNETFLTAKECLPRWRRRLLDRPPVIKARHSATFFIQTSTEAHGPSCDLYVSEDPRILVLHKHGRSAPVFPRGRHFLNQ